MLKNYLTIAIRNLMKHKLYSAINVFGLALGMASCVLMILFVRDELAFDKHFENIDDLHRLQMTFKRPNGHSLDFATSSLPPLTYLQERSGEIEDSTYLFVWNTLITNGQKTSAEVINYVAPNYFSMFEFPLQRGDPSTALQEPGSIVISPKFAAKLFPGEDPMGKTFKVTRGKLDVTVTGILADALPRTHFNTQAFVSRDTVTSRAACALDPDWFHPYCAHIYFQLKDGASIEDVAQTLQTILAEDAPGYERLGQSWPGPQWAELSTTPVKDIHLRSKRMEEMSAGGDLSLVYIFSFLSILILVIACINFTNLATARATDRSREISIRKIVGAERRQIIVQLLGESILLASLSLVIAIALVEILLPGYNAIIGKELTFNYADEVGLLVALLALSIGVGFAGGMYPAFFLSSFRPVTVSKGVFANVDRHIFLRSSLVVVQFAITIGLMSATFIVYAQMNYSKSQALQFDHDSIVAIGLPTKGIKDGKPLLLVEALHTLDGVENVSMSEILPPTMVGSVMVRREGHDNEEMKVMGLASVDAQFFKVFGVDVIAGRNFSNEDLEVNADLYSTPTEEQPETWSHAIINEASLTYLGFGSAEGALNQTIEMGIERPDFVSNLKIVGVVPDANFASTRKETGPLIYHLNPSRFLAISMKLRDGNTEKSLHRIKTTWKEYYPKESPTLKFVDESYDKFYAQEAMRGKLFAGFSLLAMLIACLGLYGLASVAAERRTQEIGLRKVMGASVFDIVKLLVWQFSQPVLIANLIAWPIAYWAMKAWLSGFAYRVDLNPLSFFAATGITLFVAFATVTWHARRVAMAKPAETLRYE